MIEILFHGRIHEKLNTSKLIILQNIVQRKAGLYFFCVNFQKSGGAWLWYCKFIDRKKAKEVAWSKRDGHNSLLMRRRTRLYALPAQLLQSTHIRYAWGIKYPLSNYEGAAKCEAHRSSKAELQNKTNGRYKALRPRCFIQTYRNPNTRPIKWPGQPGKPGGPTGNKNHQTPKLHGRNEVT